MPAPDLDPMASPSDPTPAPASRVVQPSSNPMSAPSPGPQSSPIPSGKPFNPDPTGEGMRTDVPEEYSGGDGGAPLPVGAETSPGVYAPPPGGKSRVLTKTGKMRPLTSANPLFGGRKKTPGNGS